MRAFLLAVCAALAAWPSAAADRDVDLRRPVERRSPRAATDKPRLEIIRFASAELVEVEPKSVDFGRIGSGEEREIRSAFAVRVVSNKSWVLKIVPSATLGATDGGGLIPVSRLQVRAYPSRDFVPVQSVLEIGRGKATGEAGELILLDLRLTLDTEDEPGQFEAVLDLMVEPG